MLLVLGPATNPGPQQYRGGPQGYPQQGPQQGYSNPQYPSQNQVSSQVSNKHLSLYLNQGKIQSIP